MTRENDAIDNYLRRSGVQYVITATNEGIPCITHSCGSSHYKLGTRSPSGVVGRASDISDARGAWTKEGQLLIWDQLAKVKEHLYELIYDAAPFQVFDGEIVPRSFYGERTLSIHRNHLHVSVGKGTFLDTLLPESPKQKAWTDDMAAFDPDSGGNWTVDKTGAVFTNRGAPYLGGLNGNPKIKDVKPGVNGEITGIATFRGSASEADSKGRRHGYTIFFRRNNSSEPSYYNFTRDNKWK